MAADAGCARVTPTTVRPEHVEGTLNPVEILLALARVQTLAADAEHLRAALRRQTDWAALLPLAARHGLRPLLNRWLRETAADLVPDSVLDVLHRQFVDAAHRSLFQASELLKIVRLLNAHGIDAAPHKGPALAARLYGSVTLRESGDLDLLVRPRDVWRAGTLLASIGYAPALDVTVAQRAAYAAGECDVLFVHEASGLQVELHWAITPPYFSCPLSGEQLLDRVQEGEVLGERIVELAPEDLLMVLSVNASKERWSRLEWTCGVAQLLRLNPHLDWIATLDRASRLGVRRILGTGLRLAHELLRAPVPPLVVRAVSSERAVVRLSDQVSTRLFDGIEQPPSVWSLTRFRLSSRERWRDRARYCALRVATPTYRDLQSAALPRSLFWLYYLLRPLRLMREWLNASMMTANSPGGLGHRSRR